MNRGLILLAIISCHASLIWAAPHADLITNLPGLQSTLNFSMYAGYFTVNTNNYFYWFIESAHSPANDPLVLWLNGGPGCSSLGGLLSENGPFYPDGDGNLVLNPYSWNLLANVLYLESPAGVGFSNCPQDCGTFDDNRTAVDNYDFLVQWFAAFPEFAKNKFYITGESYAGHYIPTLVNQIYGHTKTNPSKPPQSNFQGFAAGNPLTDTGFDLDGPYLNTFLQTHGCIQLGDTTDDSWDGNLNPYDILVDVCGSDHIKNHIRFPHPINGMKGLKGVQTPQRKYVQNPPACIDDWVQNYLNEPSVQKAIHAVVGTSWTDCGGPDYNFGDESMLPLYQTFMDDTNYEILVYSGDEDTVLNFIATEAWVLNFNLTATSSWSAWYYSQKAGTSQVGGWTVSFPRLTYTTIKGAGHMVPWFQPAPAFQLFQTFLQGSNNKK